MIEQLLAEYFGIFVVILECFAGLFTHGGGSLLLPVPTAAVSPISTARVIEFTVVEPLFTFISTDGYTHDSFLSGHFGNFILHNPRS